MRVQPFRLLTALVLAAIGFVPACSNGDDDGGGSSSGAPAASGCAADNRKDIFTAGMSKPAGSMSVSITQATPSPPAKGTNAMTIQVLDASGKPVDNATIVVTPFMPDHGHGSAVTPIVNALGGGKYEITKVYLAMSGLWRITVSVSETAGVQAQDATFQFCLDG